MWRKTGRLVCLLSISVPCILAGAQSKPAAYVYVSSMYGGTATQVVGFSANADGQLTPIPGSPWADELWNMAANGTFLFGSDNVPSDMPPRNIYSYRIGANGALQYLGATDIESGGSDYACNSGGGFVTLDHTGSYVYSLETDADCTSQETTVHSFKVNQTTGLLNSVGESTPTSNNLGAPLTVSTNNAFAYDFAAGADGASGYICGFAKAANGGLTALGSNCTNNPLPSGMPAGWQDYQGSAAADTTNHLALAVQYYPPNGAPVVKIATYAINTSTGALTTSSTFLNMPESLVTYPWIAMSPSGKLLAVGGSNGLQIFNFNPNGQATAATGLISRAPITEMYWDNSNHLYAISNADSTIHVFTVTPTSATEVQGSPWTVAHPVTMIVQPE